MGDMPPELSPAQMVAQLTMEIASLGPKIETQQGLVRQAMQPGGDPAILTFEMNVLDSLVTKEKTLIESRGALQAQLAAGFPAGPTDVLRSQLPLATSTHSGIKSLHKSHEFQPDELLPWMHVDPSDHSSKDLFAAICAHQDVADQLYRNLAGRPISLPTPHDRLINPLDSEAEVSARWAAHVTDPLTTLARTIQCSAQWQLQPRVASTEFATRYRLDTTSTPFLVVHSSRERCVQSRPEPGPFTASSSTSTKRKMDIALTVIPEDEEGEQQPGQHGKKTAAGANEVPPSASSAPQGAKRRRVVCMGEFKLGLTETDGQPLHLRDAWLDPDHQHHNVARALIAQTFTFMQLWHLQYSFITSWFATWVLYCPPHGRTKVFLSPVITATGDGLSPTPVGSIAWLQYQALQAMQEQVDDYRSVPAAASGEECGHGAEGGTATGDRKSSSEPDAGAKVGSNDQYSPGTGGNTYGSTSSSPQVRRVEVQAKSLQPKAPGVVQLLDRICLGNQGAVVHAVYCGTQAVVKLFGQGSRAQAAYHCELHAYTLLQPLHGPLMPVMLGAGYLVPGVRFIAMAVVDGLPMASMGSDIPKAVSAAALRALATMHSTLGFLHGDVHLNNIMLVRNAANDTATDCKFIDFGRSRFDATIDEQQQEMKTLQRFLQA